MAAFGGSGEAFDNVGFLIGKEFVDLAAKNAEREILRDKAESVLIVFENVEDVVDDEDNLLLEIGDAGLMQSGEGVPEKFVGFLGNDSFLQFVFVMKVKIESSLRDAGALGNFLNRDSIKTLLEEKLVSGLGNLVVFMNLVREAFFNFFSKARLIVSFVALIGALE